MIILGASGCRRASCIEAQGDKLNRQMCCQLEDGKLQAVSLYSPCKRRALPQQQQSQKQSHRLVKLHLKTW
jgi:hypothetical protein